MQKRTALAATVLLLGAQFALVQNSRGHDDVQPQAVYPKGSAALSGGVRFGNPYRLGSGERRNAIGHPIRGGSVRAFEVPGAPASR